MTNPETTNTLSPGHQEQTFQRFSYRLKILEDKKTDILWIFNNIETNKKTIYKMKQESIITKIEYYQIKEFIKKNGLSTRIIDIWDEDPTNHCQYEYRCRTSDLNLITSPIISNYITYHI